MLHEQLPEVRGIPSQAWLLAAYVSKEVPQDDGGGRAILG
jgi:hypothetical protein